jgi:hypothetical protein
VLRLRCVEIALEYFECLNCTGWVDEAWARAIGGDVESAAVTMGVWGLCCVARLPADRIESEIGWCDMGSRVQESGSGAPGEFNRFSRDPRIEYSDSLTGKVLHIAGNNG